MEYVKEEIFKMGCHTKLNHFSKRKETWTSKIYGKMKEHKWISTVIFAFLIFSTINGIMIYNFMKILQRV